MKKPMLLSNYPDYKEKIESFPVVYIQPKLNGWRCIIDTKNGILYSREGNIFNLPHISEDVLKMSDLPDFIDGELYCHGKTLGNIASMIRNGSREIKLYCFDVISKDIFSKRLEILMNIRETENIRTVATERITPHQIKKCYKQYLKMDLEGAVIRLDKKYENKRSSNIFKLKPIYD